MLRTTLRRRRGPSFPEFVVAIIFGVATGSYIWGPEIIKHHVHIQGQKTDSVEASSSNTGTGNAPNPIIQS